MIKKIGMAIILTLCLTLFAVAGEKDVLRALEKIRGNTEIGVSYIKYCDLLADAKTEINIYKRGKINERFLKSAEKVFTCYEMARDAWWAKMEFEKDSSLSKAAKILNLNAHELSQERANHMQSCWQDANIALDQAYAP